MLGARARQRESTGKTSRKGVPEGAATQLFAATAPELEGKGALYLEDAQVSGTTPPAGGIGCAPYALDPEAARRLWAVSEEMVGQSFDL
jgi:hypothetical protein